MNMYEMIGKLSSSNFPRPQTETHREEIKGGHWFSGEGLVDIESPDPARLLKEAELVEEPEGGEEEVLLDVVDGVVGVVAGRSELVPSQQTD